MPILPNFGCTCGSIGIVIGYAELRFQLNRITNGYIATLHRYLYYYKHRYIHKHLYIPTYEPQLQSSSFLGFPSGFKAVSMFFPVWFELKHAGRCRFELKTPTYQSYIDTYIHTYIPTWVQPQFGSIGIVIGSAELRFQLNRIKNAYIPKLHRYIHTHLHVCIYVALVCRRF